MRDATALECQQTSVTSHQGRNGAAHAGAGDASGVNGLNSGLAMRRTCCSFRSPVTARNEDGDGCGDGEVVSRDRLCARCCLPAVSFRRRWAGACRCDSRVLPGVRPVRGTGRRGGVALECRDTARARDGRRRRAARRQLTRHAAQRAAGPAVGSRAGHAPRARSAHRGHPYDRRARRAARERGLHAAHALPHRRDLRARGRLRTPDRHDAAALLSGAGFSVSAPALLQGLADPP